MSLWLCLVNKALAIVTSNPAKPPDQLNVDTNEGLTEGFTQWVPWISALFLSLAFRPRRCWLLGL